MAGPATLSTTKIRHKKIFDRYLELLKKEYVNDPEKAMSLAKSYFYKILADETGHAIATVGRMIQLQFQGMGSPPTKNKLAINKDDMDPQIRFILGFNE